MTQITPAVEACNRILLSLGSQPLYEWKWSEDLYLVMPRKWEQQNSGLMVPMEPRRDKLAKDLQSQWVVAYLKEIGEERDWNAAVPEGAHLYPGKTLWVPVATPNGWWAMRQGWEPTTTASEEFVRAVRKDRESNLTDTIEAGHRAEERRRADNRAMLAGELDPYLPLRPWLPGKRNFPVWYRRASEERMITEE